MTILAYAVKGIFRRREGNFDSEFRRYFRLPRDRSEIHRKAAVRVAEIRSGKAAAIEPITDA
jgi:hypothetical protein